MIIRWEYDKGDPYYLSAIDQWTDRREPTWRFTCKSNDPLYYDSIANWLDDCCVSGYDYTLRFNNGDPFLSVEILSEEDAIAFKLIFG